MARLVNIDTPNPKQPEEIQAQVAVQNAREIKQILAKQGVNILVNYKLETAFTGGTATATAIERFRQAFQSNGGPVEIYFKTTAETGASGNVLTLDLYLDGVKVDNCTLRAGSSLVAPMVLSYFDIPPAGKHVVDVYITLSAGTATLSFNDNVTQLKVSEILL